MGMTPLPVLKWSLPAVSVLLEALEAGPVAAALAPPELCRALAPEEEEGLALVECRNLVEAEGEAEALAMFWVE